MTGDVIETVRFRTLENTDEAAFLKAAEATNAFLETCEGFRLRRLSKGEDGEWLDYVQWTSMEAAKAAAEAFSKHPSVGPFVQAIDPQSVTMRHGMLRYAEG